MWDQVLFVVCLVLAVMSAALGIAFRCTVKRLGSMAAVEDLGHAEPHVSVIVPARNEQRDLGAAIRSLLAQEGVQLEIIIVNDHSSDRTGEIADAFAEQDSRVTVIHDPPLAAGWLGKANAMQQGLQASIGQFVVFTDADVIHASRCFATAFDELRSSHADFVSFCPLFVCDSFWENVLIPHCLVAGTVQFCVAGTNDPRSHHGAAAGAFMMMRREMLDRIGGLESVKTEMLDDIYLARSVKQHGFDARFRLAPTLLKVRLFKGNSDAFWGLTKNILGAVDRLWMAVPAMFLPVFVYYLPLLAVWIGVRNANLVLIAAGAGVYAIQLLLVFLATEICRIRVTKAVFFPAAAIPVACCFTRALYHRLVNGGIAWRGRVVSVSGT